MDEGVLSEATPEGGAVAEPMATEPLTQPKEQREEAAPHPQEEQREEAIPQPQEEQKVEATQREEEEAALLVATVNTADSEAAAKESQAPVAPGDQRESEAGGPVKEPPQEEPPEDWLEPLDEDDFEDEEEEVQGWEQGSVSGSTAGAERSGRGRGGRGGGRPRRSRVVVEEDWEDCPTLGQGWKRKEVFRRSGYYAGKSDTYYMSPTGERLRSKVELAKCLSGTVDLEMFDFKSGQFLSEHPPRKRRRLTKRRDSPSLDAGVSDDSSHLADDSRSRSPDSLYRATPVGRSTGPQPPALPYPDPAMAPLSPASSVDPTLTDDTDTQDCSTNGDKAGGALPSREGVCIKCGGSFTAASGGQTLCPKCKEGGKGRRNIVFRKWIPCGQCRACQTSVDCGACASCRSAQLNPGKTARCRKRKCLCPIRKTPFRYEAARASLAFTNLGGTEFGSSLAHPAQADMFSDEQRASGVLLGSGQLKHPSQDSDSDEYMPYQEEDDDDDDEEEFDDDGEPMKRKRRTCGKCEGCVVMRDCGTCDFCVDKPKFGGSNKKRQKCRLRQCTRQAMRHLLPLQLGEDFARVGLGRKRRSHSSSKERWEFEFSDNEGEEHSRLDSRVSMETRVYKTYARSILPQGSEKPRSPRMSNPPTQQIPPPQTPVSSMTSSRPNLSADLLPDTARTHHLEGAEGRKGVGPVPDAREGWSWSVGKKDLSNGDGAGTVQEMDPSNGTGVGGMEDEDDGIPMISQIYSLANSGIDLDGELLTLLEGVRGASLPRLWLCVLSEGPVLQLLQCCKSSPMADTVVRIGPGLGFSIVVQEQPLVPTHALYQTHGRRLGGLPEVLALLQDLERHAVCQGLRSSAPALPNEPHVSVRVATCDFLVPRSRVRCSKCRYPVDKS